MRRRTVAILIFPGVEVLDFAGPLEVFSSAQVAGDSAGERLMQVFTVAESREPLRCANPMTVVADYTLEDCPPFDILVVPGGIGTRKAVERPGLVAWIARCAGEIELTTSVCTGSFLLAQAGILDGLATTTHWGSIERLATTYSQVEVRSGARWVDNGRVLSSSGVSAGIDMSLHVVARLYGPETAQATARWIEYEYWSS
jgi:transcriptional regulator GlxA family with amidase domain